MRPFTPSLSPPNHPPPPTITLDTLLEDVMHKYLFPCLGYGDLLRLRRVCKPIKSLSDQFLRTNKRFKDMEREIHQDNLAHSVQANLPITSIRFSNDSLSSFFNKPEILPFLRIHGDRIVNVRIQHSTDISVPEIHFLANLPNLLHLEIEQLHVSKRLNQEPLFPPNFKQLKTFKMNFITCVKEDNLENIFPILDFCETLEYFKHPKIVVAGTSDESPDGYFERVMDFIRRRAAMNRKGLPNLKYYDIKHVWPSYHASSQQFCNLIRVCFEHKVKLLNVQAGLLENAPVLFATSPKILTTPIVSMVDVGKPSFFAELPNLEKLVIENTSYSNFSSDTWSRGGRERGPPKWPSLKELDLKIDSSELDKYGDGGGVATSLLVDFLFDRENKREEMRDLAIRFEGWGCCDQDDELPIPNPLDVAVSCPFLTKLTLENWWGRDEQVCLFWENLPLLEEVTLDKCKKLGDSAFVGPLGNDNPVFLQLTKLTMVALEGLDEMLGITDKSFELVFSRLKIKRFYLMSRFPLESVTRAGIECLINGDFNKSVERFPFDHWELGDVSEEEFKQLKLRFRATHMI